MDDGILRRDELHEHLKGLEKHGCLNVSADAAIKAIWDKLAYDRMMQGDFTPILKGEYRYSDDEDA